MKRKGKPEIFLKDNQFHGVFHFVTRTEMKMKNKPNQFHGVFHFVTRTDRR